MKKIHALYLAIILTALPNVAFSDTATIQLLDSKIESMNELIVTMEREEDEWQLRAAMQEHALMMKESIILSEQLLGTSTKAACGASPGNIDEQDKGRVATSRDCEYHLMITLMRHVILRQNILMQRLGLFK